MELMIINSLLLATLVAVLAFKFYFSDKKAGAEAEQDLKQGQAHPLFA